MDQSPAPSAATGATWRQRNWDELLANIESKQVIPIVGPDLLVVEREGRVLPLDRYVALELAARLELDPAAIDGGATPSLNDVMCAYLRNIPPGETRATPYTFVPDILKQARFAPPRPLQQLAEITDFTLFVTTTFDDLLAQALDQTRYGGAKGTTSIAYRYNRREDLPGTLDELARQNRATVFHLLGRHGTSPNYVLTEEDLLEFVCALQSGEYRPTELLAELATHHLLILGENFSDWLARLFIRTTRGRKLSTYQDSTEVVADSRTPGERGLVAFLTHFSGHTRIYPGGAVEFVEELHRRWRERNPEAAAPAASTVPFVAPPREIPRDAIFLSYAREDLEAVIRLKAILDRAGLPLWFDMDQIMGGQDWDRRINDNIKSCILFLPVMSRTTQRLTRKQYFRSEWNAALHQKSRYAPGEVFIVPLVVDDLERRAAEEEFPGTHVERAPGGDIEARVVDHLWEVYTRATGTARGTPR
ncbi:MAG: toll/interleukin-1 receptor domain-containing protein [Gemmatimonadales bacterium]|nr:toll/interleukin-1 receptor domain-containing protein [Gemmatimonadales bacterium]